MRAIVIPSTLILIFALLSIPFVLLGFAFGAGFLVVAGILLVIGAVLAIISQIRESDLSEVPDDLVSALNSATRPRMLQNRSAEDERTGNQEEQSSKKTDYAGEAACPDEQKTPEERDHYRRLYGLE
ncbi:phage holin family protein [Pontimonas salivibrio]|uniref:phage holin family protein n=1 Tax=Pontimonas salivibrio TaxID=1159327 RepID=UPI001319DF40|nr:phage holin family protein [Pontimonas salivibrio]